MAEPDRRTRALVDEAARAGARAMMRLGRLRVGTSVGQQRRLMEAKDLLSDALDALAAAQDHMDDLADWGDEDGQ